MKALLKAHHLLYNESKNQLSRKVKNHNKGSEEEKKTKLKKKHIHTCCEDGCSFDTFIFILYVLKE